MNDLYAHELRLYMNLFQPSFKLVRDDRKGSRKRRRYDRPQTPLDRLTELAKTDPAIDKTNLENLRHLRIELDPFVLSKIINIKLARIDKMARRIRERPTSRDTGLSAEEQIGRAVCGIFAVAAPPSQKPLLPEAQHG
jgi:hypothetical protein